MIRIEQFTFGPFQENTYLLVDENNHTIVIDPGAYSPKEKEQFSSYINDNHLKPLSVFLTHAHLDHIFGLADIVEKFHTPVYLHTNEDVIMKAAPLMANAYGLKMDNYSGQTIDISTFDMSFGNVESEQRLCPGHSPGSVVWVSHQQKFAIVGDVIFYESIGRTDLPLGNHQDLLNSIQNYIFTLPDEYILYPGHGPATTVGHERLNNPFL